jgi:glycolate oxidase iron-sulfur subunit
VKLRVDDDELALCVSCGLCLPHCPTFRVTGDESASPRGRIAAMRLVAAGAEASDEFVGYMDLCVQCRGCESACPSAVPFGRLMEGTRHSLVEAGRYGAPWRRLGFRFLSRPGWLRAATVALAVGQKLGLVPARLGLPRMSLRHPRLPVHGDGAWIFLGCVMDALQRPVHAAAQRVVEAAGIRSRPSPRSSGCCGALAAHAGLSDLAADQAARVVQSMPGAAPVLVDSAGCGAYMKDYGRVLGVDGETFAARVFDVNEWLAERELPIQTRLTGRVAVQDPCHLRHVQGNHLAVHRLLSRVVEDVVALGDDGLCCGAGGSYSLWQADMAGRIRDRKVEAIRRTGAEVVVSANPGCMLHLSGAGLAVRHPVELVDWAIGAGSVPASVGDAHG